MTRGCYMASVDISQAYRSIHINPRQWKYQGLRWEISGQMRYLVDTRLCFGISCAPYIFQTISNFVVKCMRRRGFSHVYAYLDDYILINQSFEQCATAQLTLIRLLHSLGFVIAWKKCNSPTQRIRFLGIILDSVNLKLLLPDDKINPLHHELQFFAHRSRATKHQLQKLCGYLCHCAKVIRGARTFSHRLIQLLKGLPEGNPRIRLTSEFKLDLCWWSRWAPTFNGDACMISRNYGQGPILSTDATLSGFGAVFDKDWVAGGFHADASPPHDYHYLTQEHSHWQNVALPDSTVPNINLYEFIPIQVSICRWGHLWRNKQILCLSDNTQMVQMVNTGKSENSLCMHYIREMFWCCVKFNCHLIARHIPGVTNVIPDLLSRIGEKGGFASLKGTDLCCSKAPDAGQPSLGVGGISLGSKNFEHKELTVEEIY